ncbi:hypothetical protein B0H12DRAFT_1126817 [Mycena haematopus]|nr:hypothetical protein B0H12DRAFT_1126817 [Mycena haematopus]
MFDIFDVPVRLRRSGAPEQPARATRSHATSSLSGCALNPMGPTSLPNPLVFEGPAGRRPVVRRHDLTVSAYAPQHGSEPLITVFDGPAHSGGRTRSPRASAQLGRKSVRVLVATGPTLLTRSAQTPSDERKIQLAMGAAAATAVTLAAAKS